MRPLQVPGYWKKYLSWCWQPLLRWIADFEPSCTQTISEDQQRCSQKTSRVRILTTRSRICAIFISEFVWPHGGFRWRIQDHESIFNDLGSHSHTLSPFSKSLVLRSLSIRAERTPRSKDLHTPTPPQNFTRTELTILIGARAAGKG